MLLSFALFYSSLNFAGRFQFPTIDYSYAKLYFFNLNLDKPHYMDYRIYDEGKYAASKMGSGIYLSEEINEKISEVLKNGIDELNLGLSKCFMPRHGIIYYNDSHEPVASLSICFECDKISVWSIEPFKFREDYKHFDYKKAEQQIAALKKILTDEGIPVYHNPDDVERYWQSESLLLPNERKQFAGVDLFTNFPYAHKLNLNQLTSWHYTNSTKNFSLPIDTVRTNPFGSFTCTLIRYKNSGSFYYSKNQLIEANWTSPDLFFTSSLKIGMSWSEMINLMLSDLLIKEPLSSNRFTINYLDWKINIVFDHQTIKSIELFALRPE